MRILNAGQMREADRRTIQDIGIASLVLMENAGRQVVAAIESLYPDLAERHIAVVCGKGNNGGDGFVAARTLQQRGFDVSVFVIGSVTDVKGDARTNLEILGRIGQPVVEVADDVGTARRRDHGPRPHHRRPVRHRPVDAADRVLRNGGRRHQRGRRPDCLDRHSVRHVGRHQ
jgi:hypothetical protein